MLYKVYIYLGKVFTTDIVYRIREYSVNLSYTTIF